MADTRNCDQCGAPFAPRREHARFCSARCRTAWNRRHTGATPADTGALDWSITAMQDTIGRLHRVLSRQDPGQRRITEEVFAGLRFVRNRMGYDIHPADLIQPLDAGGTRPTRPSSRTAPSARPSLRPLLPRHCHRQHPQPHLRHDGWLIAVHQIA